MQASLTSPVAQTALAYLHNQLRSHWRRLPNESHLDVTVRAERSVLEVKSRERTVDGELGIYLGTVDVPYTKLNLNAVIPYALPVVHQYPIPYRRLRQMLWDQYRVQIEDGEFAQGHQPTVAISNTDFITTPLNVETQVIELVALPASGRWVTGSTLRVFMEVSDGQQPLGPLLHSPKIASMQDLIYPR